MLPVRRRLMVQQRGAEACDTDSGVDVMIALSRAEHAKTLGHTEMHAGARKNAHMLKRALDHTWHRPQRGVDTTRSLF